MNTLKAETRDMTTKAKKLRREGYVTGNVFGKELEGSMPIQITKPDAERFLRSGGKGSQLMLDVDGKLMNVLVKEIDFNPLKGQIDEMDFQALVTGEKVHSTAEIVVLNHELAGGGVVQQLVHEIPFRAIPTALVDRIEIDASTLHIGDSVKVKDLAIVSDKDVDLQIDLDTTLVTVTAARAAVETETTEAAAEQ